MKINIAASPAYALAYVILDYGEAVYCESGAMAAMSSGLDVAGTVQGGVVRGLIRKTLGDESFFMARYTAQIDGAWVALAPKYPGDIQVLDVKPGEEYFLEAGASLGYGAGITMDTKYAGLQRIALREGATVLKVSGQGPVLLCSYGGIERIDLGDGESLVVDSGHLVAWSSSMKTRFGPLKGIISSQITGEGLVGEITGPGTVWIQTRAELGIREWIFPKHNQNRKS